MSVEALRVVMTISARRIAGNPVVVTQSSADS